MISQFFNFISGGAGLVQIDEPIGFDKVPFVARRDDNRKGVDVLFAGSSDAKFQLSQYPNHWFTEMLKVWKRYGFEMEVEYLVDYGDGNQVIGNVTVTDTDEATYINFDVTLKLSQAKFKTNYDVQTNLFSTTDLDGNPITPVSTTKMVLPAHPTLNSSSWEWSGDGLDETFEGYGQDAAFVSFVVELKDYDIKNSAIPYTSYFETGIPATEGEYQQIRDEMTLIRFIDNAKDVKINITGINLSVATAGLSVTTRITLNYGTSYETGEYTSVNLFESSGTVNLSDWSYDYTIPFVDATTMLWIQISIFQPFSTPGATPVSTSQINYSGGKLNIEATSIGKNTVIDVILYEDALRYVTKSSGGLEMTSDTFFSEIYQNQYITNLNLMRGLLDKPFNISSKDFAEDHYREEPNGDFQIQPDDTVFIGIFEDFYKNIEMAVFAQEAVEGFTREPNSEYEVNQFTIEYKVFESKKEVSEGNTNDIVHGRAEFKLTNKRAINNMNVSVGFVRDALAISKMQQKALELSKSTATQDDSKIVIIDAIPVTGAINYTETAFLQHAANGSQLVVRNDSSFSFEQLGISETGNIIIVNTVNSGVYNITQVAPTQLNLVLAIGDAPENITAGANTTFTYTIDPDVDLIARTSAGFSEISGFYNQGSFINLPWTVARNMRRFYNSELATANLFHKDEPLKNTLYTNNPNATTRLTTESVSVVEGGNFMPQGAILTPWLINAKIECTMQQFFALTNVQRTQRGYITVFDPSGMPVSGYIKEASWIANTTGDDLEPDEFFGEMTVILKERYTEFYITLNVVDDILIDVNGTAYDSDYLYTLEDGIFSIFESSGKQILYDVPFDRVSPGFATEADLIEYFDGLVNVGEY